MEEAVKQLAPLVSTGPNWPYTLVQLNRDAHHAPLPTEGHLSIMVEGSTRSATCGRIGQLEVCQLLSSGSQVIYPAGLNGCEVPVIASPPKSLAKGANLLGGKPIYLQVDIPQSSAKEPEPKALPPGSHSTSILVTSPSRAPLPKVEGQVSMTMEVRELLSQAALDTWACIRELHPRKARAHGLKSPLYPPKLEYFPWPVDVLSQVSIPDDAEMEDASLKEITATSPLQPKPKGPAVMPLP